MRRSPHLATVSLALLLAAALLAGCGPSQREARHHLADGDVPFTEAEFAQRAGAGDRDTLQLFFDAGMALNAAEEREAFPLVEAAAGGHTEIVDLLLEREANPRAEGENGRTALIAAVSSYDTTITDQERADVVQTLLDAGANPKQTYVRREYPGSPSSTVLSAAVRDGREEAVRLLLEAGADPRRDMNEEILAEADSSTFDLLREAGADVKNGLGLYAAACLGRMGLVKDVLEAGVSPSSAVRIGDATRSTALGCAVKRNDMAMVSRLLASGADVNRGYGYEYLEMPLMTAAEAGRTGTVKVLLEAGANPNNGGGEYPKAIMSAVRGGHKEMVQMLLQAGADVNIYEGYGSRLLEAASEGGHSEITGLLREAGARG